MPNSREIGATFERKVAKELYLLTGVHFRRHLKQYQARDLSDLVADDCPEWPFSIEAKRRASGGFQSAWWAQSEEAAKADNLIPCVVWQISRSPIRVRVPVSALRPGMDGECDLTLEGFAQLAAELMAEKVAA